MGKDGGLGFAKVLEDEGGLTSGEVTLSFDVPCLGECFT